MIKNKQVCAYVSIFILIFLLDRITKLWALSHWISEYQVFKGLSFLVVFNRGISWGIANTPNSLVYCTVTALIIFVTCCLVWYTRQRYRAGYAIYGELCVLAGSVSNIIDRFVYGGVVDYILLYWKQYTFPIFNIADIAIVLGVGLMFLQLHKAEKAESERT